VERISDGDTVEAVRLFGSAYNSSIVI